MWNWIANFILKARFGLLLVLLLGTFYFAWVSYNRVELSHEFMKVVPETDVDMIEFREFQRIFGNDANAVIICLKADNWFETKRLNSLKQISDSLKKFPGVRQVLNITTAQKLQANDSLSRYEVQPLMNHPLLNIAEADSLKAQVLNLPFYEGLLLSKDQKILVSAVTYDDAVLSTAQKNVVTNTIKRNFEAYAKRWGAEVYFAGMPYLRTYVAQKLPMELLLFTCLSLLLTAIALFWFYRSWYAVIFPLILLIICSVWTLGIICLLGYKLNQLTGLLPAIIIILGIPPSIYMLSEYHEEFVTLGDKMEALRRMIHKLGLVTFMINANTAFGFLTLYLTEVVPLQQFGLTAFLGTMASYLITIILVPSVFSLLPAPSSKLLKHLDAPLINRLVLKNIYWVNNHRRWIYTTTFVLIALSGFGIFKLKAVSFMVDDLPSHDRVITDLRFIEGEFGGVMPFEIVIDSQKKNGVRNPKFLRQLEELQKRLEEHPSLSRTISIADLWKWSRQALLDGDPSAYSLPTSGERDYILRYLQGLQAYNKKQKSASNMGLSLANLVDSTNQKARITGYVQDIGSVKMPGIIANVQAQIDTVFGKQSVKSSITGTTKLFLKTNELLIDNLVWSLVATFLIIGLQMLLLFRSWRIMVISMIPNLIPLWVTAGVMGWLGIYLKPSTALIYELAFGIAIDNSIHYLAAYRYYMIHQKQDEPTAINSALRVTGMGIIYTSVVLFIGFAIFTLSTFGSTRALGILTASTLFIALFSNLLLMPAMLKKKL